VFMGPMVPGPALEHKRGSPQGASARHTGAPALTLTEIDPPLLTKTDPLTPRGIVFV
jgi:hypothetical protein